MRRLSSRNQAWKESQEATSRELSRAEILSGDGLSLHSATAEESKASALGVYVPDIGVRVIDKRTVIASQTLELSRAHLLRFTNEPIHPSLAAEESNFWTFVHESEVKIKIGD